MASNSLIDLSIDKSLEMLNMERNTPNLNTTYIFHSSPQCETSRSPLPSSSPFVNSKIIERFENDFSNSIQKIVEIKQDYLNYYKRAIDSEESNHEKNVLLMREKHKKCELYLTKERDLARTETEKHKENFDRINTELRRLKNELEDCQQGLSKKESTIQELSIANHKLQQDYDSCLDKLREAEIKLEETIARYGDVEQLNDNQIESLKKSLEIANKANIELQAQLETSSQTDFRQKEELGQARLESKDLQKQLEVHRSKVRELKDQLTASRSANHELSLRFESQKKQAEETLREREASLQEKIETITNQRLEDAKKYEAKIQTLEQLVQRKDQETIELRAECNTQIKEIENLHKQNEHLDKLGKEKERLVHQKLENEKQLEARIQVLESDLHRSNQEVVKLRAENDSKNGEIGSMHKQIERLNKFSQDKESLVHQLQAELDEYSVKVDNISLLYADSQAQLESTRAQLKASRDELRNSNNQTDRLRQEFQTIQNDLETTKTELENLKTELQVEAAEKNDKMVELRRVRQELESSESDVDTLREKNRELQSIISRNSENQSEILTRNNDLRDTLSKVENSRRELNTALFERNAQIRQLEVECEEKTKQMQRLQAELGQLEVKHKDNLRTLDTSNKTITQLRDLVNMIFQMNPSIKHHLGGGNDDDSSLQQVNPDRRLEDLQLKYNELQQKHNKLVRKEGNTCTRSNWNESNADQTSLSLIDLSKMINESSIPNLLSKSKLIYDICDTCEEQIDEMAKKNNSVEERISKIEEQFAETSATSRLSSPTGSDSSNYARPKAEKKLDVNRNPIQSNDNERLRAAQLRARSALDSTQDGARSRAFSATNSGTRLASRIDDSKSTTSTTTKSKKYSTATGFGGKT